jgi:hypothetical protein
MMMKMMAEWRGDAILLFAEEGTAVAGKKDVLVRTWAKRERDIRRPLIC